jgi:hypothetical protein
MTDALTWLHKNDKNAIIFYTGPNKVRHNNQDGTVELAGDKQTWRYGKEDKQVRSQMLQLPS